MQVTGSRFQKSKKESIVELTKHARVVPEVEVSKGLWLHKWYVRET